MDGIENLAAGRFTVRQGLGVGVEAATTHFAQVGLDAIFGFSILYGLNALTTRARWHPISTSRQRDHYPKT